MMAKKLIEWEKRELRSIGTIFGVYVCQITDGAKGPQYETIVTPDVHYTTSMRGAKKCAEIEVLGWLSKIHRFMYL